MRHPKKHSEPPMYAGDMYWWSALGVAVGLYVAFTGALVGKKIQAAYRTTHSLKDDYALTEQCARAFGPKCQTDAAKASFQRVCENERILTYKIPSAF